MYRRYCRLTITPEDNGTTNFVSLGSRKGSFADFNSITFTEQTAIDFNVQSSFTGFGNKAEISIYGLSSDTAFFMTKMINKYINQPITFLITLEAGSYDNHGVIFCGRAIEVVVDESKSDYVLSMSLLGEYPKVEIFTLNFNGEVDLGSSIKTFFETKGYRVENNLVGENAVKVSNLYFKDKTLPEICSSICMDFKNKNVFMDFYYEEKVVRIGNISFMNEKTSPFILSEKTGMIASPNPNIQKKVSVRSILNNSITDHKYGRSVRIESIKFPEINGNKFVLANVNHIGQTRGNTWETKLELAMEGYGYVNAAE